MGGEATHAARALYEAVARGSDDALWERLDRDVTWHGVGSWRRLGRRELVARGRAEALEAFAELRRSAARIVLGESVERGDRVVVEVEASRPRGAERAWYAVITVDAGRVVRIRDHVDRDAALHDVGLRRSQVPPRRRPAGVP
jgi:ketosteroid isomerase-like protein